MCQFVHFDVPCRESYLALEHIKFEAVNNFNAGTATDEQACIDAAYKTDPTFEAISFNPETGDCWYHTEIGAPYGRPSGEQPIYWLRIDLHMHLSAVTACLTNEDARYLLMQMNYKDQECFQVSFQATSSVREP